MYSQNNEDQFALNFFKDRSSKKTVLDIGANDGKTFSNSLLLIENGWRGHLLEPSSTFSKCVDLHLQRIRERQVCLYNCGIAERDEVMDFYESGTFEGEDLNLVSCIEPNEMNRWKGSVEFNKTKAYFFTFETWIKNNQWENQTFDFISIDVEGHDWIVLSQIDLEKYKCQLLCIEWNSKPELASLFTEYANKFNMHEVHRNAENIIFAKKQQ